MLFNRGGNLWSLIGIKWKVSAKQSCGRCDICHFWNRFAPHFSRQCAILFRYRFQKALFLLWAVVCSVMAYPFQLELSSGVSFAMKLSSNMKSKSKISIWIFDTQSALKPADGPISSASQQFANRMRRRRRSNSWSGGGNVQLIRFQLNATDTQCSICVWIMQVMVDGAAVAGAVADGAVAAMVAGVEVAMVEVSASLLLHLGFSETIIRVSLIHLY